MSILKNKLTLPFVLPNTFPAAVNKVVVNGETLIDLTNDTVTPEDVMEGVTFHMADGTEAVGTNKKIDFLDIYPIGAIYISVNDVNPNTLFGGTWEKIKDRFLLASGDTYSLGATGGEATHKLTINELPNHNHIQRKVASNGEMGYIVNKTKNGDYTGDELGINQVSWYTNKAPVTTESIGGSKPHNNMPPYLVVNMWQRIS